VALSNGAQLGIVKLVQLTRQLLLYIVFIIVT
jgi:hypothetical protein